MNDITPVGFKIALDKFLTQLKKAKRSSATVVAYSGDLMQVLNHFEGRRITQVTTVTADMLKEYLDSLFTNGYTPKSISRKINSLKTFFKFCLQEQIITDNPVANINHPRIENAPPRILSPIEYRGLRDACRLDIRLAAIVELLMQTGIRISELANLQIEDIKKNELIIQSLENNPARTIPLNKSATQAIQNYLAIRSESKNTHLFVTKTGNPLLIRNIRTAIDRCFKAAGVKNAKVNDLRHTFIAHQLTSGVSSELVYRIVGHRRAASTEKYLEHIKIPKQIQFTKLVDL